MNSNAKDMTKFEPPSSCRDEWGFRESPQDIRKANRKHRKKYLKYKSGRIASIVSYFFTLRGKKCPSCGYQHWNIKDGYTAIHLHGGAAFCWIECWACGSYSPGAKSWKKAYRAWEKDFRNYMPNTNNFEKIDARK